MDAERYSILHVLPSVAARYGGPARAVVGMASGLAARGHRVEVFTTDWDGPGRLSVDVGASIKSAGYSTRHFGVSAPRFWFFSPAMARALWSEMRRFDVVHIHSLYLFHALAASRTARHFGVPYVVRPHGTLDPYHWTRHRRRKALEERLFTLNTLDCAAGLHFTTEVERDNAARLRLKPRSFVVPLGVDVAALPTPGADDALRSILPDLRDDDIVVTFLGRLCATKNPDLVLRAFARVAEHHPSARLVLAGPDEDRLGRGLRSEAAARGLGHRVDLPGLVDGPAKQALLARSALFVLPSASENMGIAVLEAMAAGVPVAVSAGVAISGEIGAASAGVIVERDADSIADAIDWALRSPADAARMGGRGRDLVERRYSWAAAAAGLEAMYASVLAN